MRDPRTLGPYQPAPPLSFLDLIRGQDYTAEGAAPAPAMAQAAEAPPSIGQRIAGWAGDVGSNLAGAASSLVSLPLLLPQVAAARLKNNLSDERAEPAMRQAAAQARQVALLRSQQEAQLAAAQLPARQAEAEAQVRNQGALTDRITAAGDPKLRESLIRGAATGEFRPYAVEPGPAELAAYQQVLGMEAEEAKQKLTAAREIEQTRLQAGLSAEQARLTAGLQRETNRLDNEGRRETTLAGKMLPGIEDEKAMRAEFEGLQPVKNFTEVSQAYKVIQKLPATKVGDLTLLVKYMKLVDPGSSVREGELATADNAGGVPAYIRAQYNRLSSSAGRLDDDVRSDFVARAGDLYQGYLGSHRNLEEQYRANAIRHGIDPRGVVTDFVGKDEAPAKPPTPDEIRAELARRANAGR